MHASGSIGPSHFQVMKRQVRPQYGLVRLPVAGRHVQRRHFPTRAPDVVGNGDAGVQFKLAIHAHETELGVLLPVPVRRQLDETPIALLAGLQHRLHPVRFGEIGDNRDRTRELPVVQARHGGDRDLCDAAIRMAQTRLVGRCLARLAQRPLHALRRAIFGRGQLRGAPADQFGRRAADQTRIGRVDEFETPLGVGDGEPLAHRVDDLGRKVTLRLQFALHALARADVAQKTHEPPTVASAVLDADLDLEDAAVATPMQCLETILAQCHDALDMGGDLVGGLGGNKIGNGPAQQILLAVAAHAAVAGVGFQQHPLRIDDQEAVHRGVEQAAVALVGLALRLGGGVFLRHVAKVQHHAAQHAGRVEDGRGAIGDLRLCTVAGDQQRVVGQGHGLPGFEHTRHRVGHGGARECVDDAKHRRQRLAQGLGAGPAGQALGDGVHARHAARGVGGDDGVADGLQGDAQVFLARPQPRLGLVLVERHFEHGAQLALGEGLEDVAQRFGKLGARQRVALGIGGEKDHRQRELAADGQRCGDAIDGAGQLDVHQYQVRPQLPGQRDGLLTTGGAARDLVAQIQQQLLDVAGDDGFVFDDQDS